MKTKSLDDQLRAAVASALKKGWSMNAFAKAAGVSRSAIRGWYFRERGGLGIDTIQGLMAFFGMVAPTAEQIPDPPETHHRKPTKKGASHA